MLLRLSWKELTALSVLLPLLSAAPASARRDGGEFRFSPPERNLPNSFQPAFADSSGRHGSDVRAGGWSASVNHRSDNLNLSLGNVSRSDENLSLSRGHNRAGDHLNLSRGNVNRSGESLSSSRSSSHRSNDNFNRSRGNNYRTADDVSLTRGDGRAQLELDLTSEDKTIVLPSKLFRDQAWVTVDVGGATRTYAEGQLVTPAEYVAISQALRNGTQSLSLNERGAAASGQFSLDLLKQPQAFRFISELVIPERVVAIDDVSKGALKISGDLINHGQILGVSSIGRGQEGKVLAANILNFAGAVISMDSSIGGAGGADPADSASTGVTSPSFISNLVRLGETITAGTKLLLSASDKIVNDGTIFSAGNLTVSAPEIRNHGVMFSGDSLVIETQKLVNAGVVKAMGATMSLVGTSVTEGLTVINDGGSLDASRGNLLVSAAAPIKVIGGALNAELVKFNTPYSMVDVAVDSISGLVDVVAFSSAVHVKEGDLAINNINVLGDPIFTNSSGNIVLPANITAAGGPVTAVAAGDIVGAAGGTVIDTSSANVTGGEVILLAGVSNVTSGGTTTVAGASGLNGSIYGITGINASGDVHTDGGNVTLGAFGGSISLLGSIVTNGQNGGHVTVLSPGNITIGDVTSSGEHLAQDYITIQTVNPSLAGALKFDSTGKLTQGSIGIGSAFGSGSIVAGNLDSGVRNGSGDNAGNINVKAGGAITTGFLRAMGGGAPGRGWALQGWDYGSNGGNGGSISLAAQGGGVIVNGDVNSSGGGGGGANHSAGGQGGDGGNLIITALADVILNGPVLAPGGGGGGGVGISSTDTAGGGGSLGNGGGPNSGGLFYAPPPYDGPAYLDNGLNLHNPNHPRFPYAGMGGSNTAYDIGCCGSGYGGDVGESGENGDQGTFAPRGYWNDTSPHAGGAPGLGGNISIAGRDISVTKTIQTYFATKNDIDKSPYADFSIFTHSKRGGGQINLTTSGGNVASTVYAANSDLESTSLNVTAQLRPGQVTLAGKMRGDVVKLNGSNLATTVSAGVLAGSGTGVLAISENGSTKTISNGSLVTPAEWIALIQKGTTGSQPLQLGNGGNANSGTFDIAAANLPGGGFTNLLVPTNVTAAVKVASLSATTATVKGHLQFGGDATFNSNNLTVTGDVAAANAALSFDTQQLNLNGGSSITAGDVTVKGSNGLIVNLASGGLSPIISSTSGGSTFGASGQALSFSNSSGGPGSINFTGGPIDIVGSTFSNASSTSLLFGNNTTITLSGATFQNLGSIKVNDPLGNAGALQIQSSAPNFALGAGTLSVAPTIIGGGHGGSLTISASGNLTVTATSLDASALGSGNSDGGLLSILARSLSVSGSALSLQANGVGSGSGGTVSVTTTASDSDLVVDGASAHLLVSAHGGTSGSSAGDGGHLDLSAGRNLTVSSSSLDLGPRGINGGGAQIDLEAGTSGNGNLLFTGLLGVNGIGNGSGGSIRVASNSANAFTIGSAGSNSVSTGLSADGGASGGAGGSLSIENAGTGGIKIAGSSFVSADATAGSGGKLHLKSDSGLIDLASGIYSFNGVGSNSDGGELSISAGQLSVGAGGAQFSANGAGQGDGGLIDVTVKQNQNLTFSNSFVTAQATGGSPGSSAGSGGTIHVSTGGDLSFAAGSINAAAQGLGGNGGNYALAAGTLGAGTLLINDSLNSSGKGNGSGGNIDLSFAAAQPFVIGGTGLVNGVTGSLTASGAGTGASGNVSIENKNNSALDVVLNSSVGAGVLTLNCINNISLDVLGTLSGKVNAQGLGVNLVNQTGGLTIGTVDAGLNGVDVTANGALDIKGPVTSGAGIKLNSFDALNVDGALSGDTVDLASGSTVSGGINVNAAVVGSTSVSVASHGTSSILFGAGAITAPDVTIATESGDVFSNSSAAVLNSRNANFTSIGGNIGSVGTALTVVATNLSVNTGGSGAVHLNSAGTGQLNLLNSSAGAEFVLGAHGSTNINDITTNAGDVSITTSSGKLYVSPNANILAVDGDVNLRNDDFKGSIAVGANSTIKGSSTTAGLGDVYIGFGAIPSQLPKPKKHFKNVNLLPTNGGAIHVSKGGLQAASPDNNLIAEGRQIVFQNASKKKKDAISLEGNVTIIADPPSVSTAVGALASPILQGSSETVTLTSQPTAESAPQSLQTSSQSLQTSPAAYIPSLSTILPTKQSTRQDSTAAAVLSTDTANILGRNLNLISTSVLTIDDYDEFSESKNFATGSSSELMEVGLWSHDDLLNDQFKSRSTKVVSSTRSNTAVSNEVELTSGAVLFAPSVDTVVSLKGMKVKLSAKSVALVVSSNDSVSVYDLDDRHKQSVLIESKNDRIALSPGQHVTVSSTSENFGDINPLEAISHRGLNTAVGKDGKRVFTSEFSISDALDTIQPLRDVLHSRHQNGLQLSANLLKTAAVIMQLRGTSDFQTHGKTQLAAWRNSQ